MIRIVSIILFVFTCISCKTVSSDTKGLLYKNSKGIYYYAWEGVDGQACIGICSRNPDNPQEALTKVCNNGVKYYNRYMKLLATQFVSSTSKNLAFLYENTEDSEDAKEKCLAEDVIKSVNVDDVVAEWVTESNGSGTAAYSHPYLWRNYWGSSSYIGEVPRDQYYEFRINYKIPDIIYLNEDEIIIKPIKYGLTYDQAMKYCSEPDEKLGKYVDDWSKVRLGFSSYLAPADCNEDTRMKRQAFFWMTQEDKNSDKVKIDDDVEISKDSKGIYTACTTNESNIKGVYFLYLYPEERWDSDN